MKKTIKGKTHKGVKRSYTFNLLSAKVGVLTFHHYASIAIAAFPFIKDYLSGLVDDVSGKKHEENEEKNQVDIIALIPQIFTTTRIEELAKLLLANATIDSSTVDEDGFCDLFKDDVIEFYIAIFWGVVANYPTYLLPFLVSDESDTTPAS